MVSLFAPLLRPALVGIALALVAVLVPPAPVAGADTGLADTGLADTGLADELPVTYRPPVEGEIIRHFELPATPYGPGNRGIDYRTAVGAPVRAAASGQVVFAGLVAGSRHVTVLHADGLRTSYSFLATVDTHVGAPVGLGDQLGTSSGEIHFGVRRGDEYLDPELVLGGAAPRVHLVPVVESGPAGVHAEGLALLGTALHGLVGGRLSTLAHYSMELQPDTHLVRLLVGVHERIEADCSAPDLVPSPPTGRRVAILVGGLGTTSERSSIDRLDTATLGYAADDVVRFSYRGGRTPATPPGGSLRELPARAYDAEDSQGDLVAAADELRELVATVAAAQPGVPIDLYAHSQGGVVAQLALSDLVAGSPLPDSVGLLATIGSPHQGTDLATAISAIEAEPAGPALLDQLGEQWDVDLDPGAPAVGQLSETSPLIAELMHSTPPPGVALVSVGARGDLTVPAGHTAFWDAPNPIVDLRGPDAHSDLPGAPETTRELALALAGAPPTCHSVGRHLIDVGTAEGISWFEDAVGFTVWQAVLP